MYVYIYIYMCVCVGMVDPPSFQAMYYGAVRGCTDWHPLSSWTV